MVEITPEIRAQLDEAKKQCPFCKIIESKIPAEDVYSDDNLHAILDVNPWVKGHVLLMPKEHYPIMPYLPPETFKDLFGKMPKFIKALKKSMVATGANIVIANGAVAGQQSPHFLIHVLPRESGDKMDKYAFTEPKNIDSLKSEHANKLLSQNLPIMMKNHFGRNPSEWRQQEFQNRHVYEDEKVICKYPDNPQCVGHLEVISKDFNDFEEMDKESASHLFFTASFCATAVFEGLGAHGSNIIMKTGYSSDNNNELSVHILPRYQDDGLDLIGAPMENKPDNKSVAKKIKDETFIVNYIGEKKTQKIIDMNHKLETIFWKEKSSINNANQDSQPSSSEIFTNVITTPQDEINAAINSIINSRN